jgi:hypothetical protein
MNICFSRSRHTFSETPNNIFENTKHICQEHEHMFFQKSTYIFRNINIHFSKTYVMSSWSSTSSQTPYTEMDYLLRVAEEQYGRTRDPYLLDVYNLADFCYRKWGDTSDYDRLLRMIHREPLFGLAPTSGYLFASRGRVSERKRFA